MIRARTSNGWFIFGLTTKDIAALKSGSTLKIDLAVHGGKDTVIILYGEDNKEIYGILEQITGAKLPEGQTMPPEGG
jgi:hypothetical protein